LNPSAGLRLKLIISGKEIERNISVREGERGTNG